MSRRNKQHSKKKKRTDTMVAVPFGIKHVAKHPKYIRNVQFDEKLFLTILKHPDNEKYQHEFPKYIFEPNMWGQYNKEYKTKFQPSKIKGMRILIQIGSIHAILTGKYHIYNNMNLEYKKDDNKESESNYKIIQIPKNSVIQSVSKTVMHFEDHLFGDSFFEQIPNIKAKIDNIDNVAPKIVVVNDDMLDVSKYIMQKYHMKPLVLVMSSRTYPGGGYKKGAGAQEEDMCRRSTLFCNLEDPYNFRLNKNNNNQVLWSYPLPEYGGIYSPNVLVFRNGMNQNYSFYEKHPLKMSFVSVYAFSSPNLDSNNRLSKNIQRRTMKKIETILRIGMLHKHKCLVLSAFGCGAYGNPPLHMAQLFKRVIFMKDEYRHFFTMIVFAIIDDKNTHKAHNPNGNVKPYAETFGVPILTLSDSPSF